MLNFTEADVMDPPKPAEWLDGMGVVHQSTYARIYTYQIIAGSGIDPEYKDRVLMKGCRWCLKMAKSWSYTSSTWGGLATELTERYLRRFYPKKIFFDDKEIWPILYKIRDRFWMADRTWKAYIDYFLTHNHSRWCRAEDEYPVLWKGKVRYLTGQHYKMCLAIYKQTERLDQLEKMKDEEISRN